MSVTAYKDCPFRNKRRKRILIIYMSVCEEESSLSGDQIDVIRHDGELPRREDLTEPYAASPLYSVIQKRADYLISTRFSRYDDTRQGVAFTERRKQEFRNLLSQMEVLPTA